ncbi:MAG: sigma-70 family RNA polymerase sigma factor [Myxococcales bacterium]|nr:sigma-70 family RNA polymerase sigma factor [Myxococcales bacterium]
MVLRALREQNVATTDREDALQDVVMRLLEDLARPDAIVTITCSLAGYLLMRARSRMLDARRSETRRTRMTMGLPARVNGSSELQAQASEAISRLDRIIEASSYRSHLRFILEYAPTLDLSIREIENLLDLTNATACRVHATLRALVRRASDETLDR